MDHNLSGTFESIVIKPLHQEHIELLRLVRNRDDVRTCFFYSGIISAEEQKKWYTSYLQQLNEYMFSIFSQKTGDWIGAAALYHVDDTTHQAEFGRFLIAPPYKKCGFGKIAVRGVCSIGFTQLKLDSIYLEVFENNHAARTCYTNTGFCTIQRFKQNGLPALLMKLDRNLFKNTCA